MLPLQRTSDAPGTGAGGSEVTCNSSCRASGTSAASGVFHVHMPSFTRTHIEMQIVLKRHSELKLMLHVVVIKENKSLITL